MIGRLTGRLAERTPGHVVLDVNGVGYDVQVPLGTFYALAGDDGRACSLLIHTHVREDAIVLFGFATETERETFRDLLGIGGVGPRVALAVLSGIEPVELEKAVRESDRSRLQRIPGIGKKTAERILLEMRDRLERRGRRSRSDGEEPGSPRVGAGRSEATRADAVAALVQLGYGRDAADGAVDAAVRDAGPDAAIEAVLRAALGRLVR